MDVWRLYNAFSYDIMPQSSSGISSVFFDWNPVDREEVESQGLFHAGSYGRDASFGKAPYKHI